MGGGYGSAALLLAAGAAACGRTALAAGGCAMRGSSCVCEDADGTSWDLTALTAPAASAPEGWVTARGPCTGTYCTGTWRYFVEVCESLEVPQSLYIGHGCLPTDQLNLYRVEEGPRGITCLAGSGTRTGCQCDSLGELGGEGITVTPYDDGGDEGVTLTYTNNVYYNSYAGWVRPVVNLICDPGASDEAYSAAATATTNPEVLLNPIGCTTNYCSMTMNWRTPAACASGGAGWTITWIIVLSGLFYVGAGVTYGRSKNPPKPGDGALAHPDGGGAVAWHPHYESWGEGKELVLAGFKYTKMRWHMYRNGGSAQGYEAVEKAALNGQQYDDDLAKRTAAGGADDDADMAMGDNKKAKKKQGKAKAAGAGQQQRRGSESELDTSKSKKKKKKKKPRPSLPAIDGGGGGLE